MGARRPHEAQELIFEVLRAKPMITMQFTSFIVSIGAEFAKHV